jgi:hypothetical protein
MDVKVVENADNCVHITMPMAPGGNDLSDEELSTAAGGGSQYVETDHCSANCLWG